ncbi:NADH dehydrogenase [subsurface metagenome]
MLSIAEAIQQRRSIRSFKDSPVSQEMILQMLEAARLAPSASNLQPWRFVVVTDAEEKKRLRQLCLDQAFIEEASVVFVACADLSAYSKKVSRQRYQEFIDTGVELSGRFTDSEFRKIIDSMPEPDPRTITAPATANTYIAIEHLVLMATALGLGSCWVGALTDHGAIKTLLGLPENIWVVALVAVGYPKSVPPPRPRLSLEKILLRPVPQTSAT